MFLVTCNHCSAQGWTENGADLDAAVRCDTPAGTPPGSTDGCCATNGMSHEEHIAYVRLTGDATARPVTITVPPGRTHLKAAS
jgi:hypothetical protein